MYCYLAQSKKHNLTKIGFSKNPQSRKKNIIVSENDKTIDFINVSLGGNNLEKRLHRIFAEKRIRGEWFLLSDSDILQAKLIMCDSIDIKSIKSNDDNAIGQFIKLRPDVKKQAKLLAIESDVSMSEWCASAIEEKINRELKSKSENYKNKTGVENGN